VAFGFRATCAADGGVSGAQCAATSRGACHGRRPNHGAGRPAWHANGSVAACGKLSLAGVVLVGPELTQGPRHVTGRRGASCLAVARLHTATETLSVRIRACSSGGRTAAATYLVATVPTASLAAGPTDPRIAPISSAADAPVVDASVSPRLAPAGPAPRGARPHRHGPGRPGAVLHPVPGRQRRRPGRAADRAGGDHHPGPALAMLVAPPLTWLVAFSVPLTARDPGAPGPPHRRHAPAAHVQWEVQDHLAGPWEQRQARQQANTLST
jgi:hypothetical protein